MSLGHCQSRKKKNQFEKTNLAVCECEVGEPHAVGSLKIAMIKIDNEDKKSEDHKLRFAIIMIDNDKNDWMDPIHFNEMSWEQDYSLIFEGVL